MRQPIIVGNWKMHTILEEARGLVRPLKEELGHLEEVEIGICPPFVYLALVREILKGSNIKLGAQNAYGELKGAFTGEISPQMLKDMGCAYVIIGHSERRHIMGETDEMINKKLRAVLKADLTAIFCIGELLEERESGTTETVLRRQLEAGLKGFSSGQLKQIIIAYEPVWAIGTGQTATSQQAQEVHAFIREFITRLSDETRAEEIRIMYGGSVNPENISDLMAQPDVDGALVGGASLKADSFIQIVTRSK